MDSAPLNPLAQAAPAAAAVGNLVSGLTVATIASKLKQNSAMKDACSRLLRSHVIRGRLARQVSPGTWEVDWTLGDSVAKAWHQVRWIINPNNCTIVGANPAPSHILPAAAAAPQGAAPSDAAQNEADDTSSESSESDGDGEAEIDAPMEAVPAVPGAQQDSLCPHGLRWTLENEPISIDAREGSNFTPSEVEEVGEHPS